MSYTNAKLCNFIVIFIQLCKQKHNIFSNFQHCSLPWVALSQLGTKPQELNSSLKLLARSSRAGTIGIDLLESWCVRLAAYNCSTHPYQPRDISHLNRRAPLSARRLLLLLITRYMCARAARISKLRLLHGKIKLFCKHDRGKRSRAPLSLLIACFFLSLSAHDELPLWCTPRDKRIRDGRFDF
jgi:hypothetical protein